MLALIDRVAAVGPPRNTAVSHTLQGPVWEFIQGSLRILWFYGNGRIVVCSHAMAKKGQKTPSQDIARAARMAAEYRAAGGRVEVLTDDQEDD
jgi:phage-related protein